MTRPRAGAHYPRSFGEFLSWFSTDDDCRDFLVWMRWPEGFVCDKCHHVGGWALGDGRWECAACSHRTSVTAGTIFDRTRTPLTVWFHACWAFATAKDGVSALALQRDLQIGSYQTAWAMLHRIRSALIRPGREQLAGTVEVDETYFGGEEKGLAGGRAKGKKQMVVLAVEQNPRGGLGRTRMRIIHDAKAESLRPFIADNIAQGARVITDGWNGYRGIEKLGYIHDRRSQRAVKAAGGSIDGVLPGVHRVAALAKRWLDSTHQGSFGPKHLSLYLDEYASRFNRRTSRSQGMLFYPVIELAIGHDPVRYKNLVRNKRPRKMPPRPPGATGRPPSIDRPTADRPWRSPGKTYSG